MNFISSIYLWLLPLISIPLLIYLFNKNRLKDIHFSSLIFLNKIKSDSIKRINITNILLLIIRTLIVLFFILMMTRPTYNSYYNSNNNIDALVIIAVDNSVSMSNNLNDIKNITKNITSSFSDETNIKIIELGNNEVIYRGKKKEIDSLNKIKIKKTFKPITSKSINKITDDNYDNLNIFLFIVSDGQNHFSNPSINIPNNKNFHLHYIYTNKEKRNLSIKQIDIDKNILLPNDTFKISVTIENNGNIDIEDSFASLIINETHSGKEYLSITRREKDTIEFEASIPNYGEHLCKIVLSDDDILEDNTYYFTINIPKSIEIDIISNKSNIYLENALNAFNVKEDIIKVNYYTLNTYLDKKINANILFIIGMSNISNELKKKIYNLNKFPYFKVIVIPEINDKNLDSISNFIDQNKQIDSKRVNYAENNYMEIKSQKINDPFLASIYRDIPTRNIKIFNYIEMDSDKNTVMRLENNKFLLNRFILNHKKVELNLLSISLNLQSSNWPLKGSLIPFIQNLITTKNLMDYTDIHKQLKEMKIYKNSKIISPKGRTLTFATINENSLLNELGFYKKTINSHDSYFSVNLGEKELSSKYVEYEKIGDFLNKEIVCFNTPKNAAAYVDNIIVGNDLWKFFLYLVIIFLFIEMFLNSIYIRND